MGRPHFSGFSAFVTAVGGAFFFELRGSHGVFAPCLGFGDAMIWLAPGAVETIPSAVIWGGKHRVSCLAVLLYSN